MKREEHSATVLILRRTVGFIIFLILLLIANTLASSFNNSIYSNIMQFFNINMPLFFILFVMGTINDLFWSFYFPWNMLAPVTGSILSIFIVTFLDKIWLFADSYIHSGFTIPIGLVTTIVFIIVFISGYFYLARRGIEHEEFWNEKEWKKWKDWKKGWYEEKMKDKHEIRKRKKVDWGDVGEEFKLALYNLGDSINRAFDDHKKEDKKSKRKKK